MAKLATRILLAGAALALGLIPASAQSPAKDKISNLSSANFGWQTNVADWQEPPAGSGHGPIKPDPEHPYTSNADAGRAGTQPTLRLGDSKDPVLKPWAAKLMLDSNKEALAGIRQVPFAAQARCYPGGVPGQLLFPFEPVYFIQMDKIVYMMWQRDHMVRRVKLTDKHSGEVAPTWFGDSIGHYENGDTFVVDTVGLSTKNSYIDNFRTPHTEKLHVVERFTMSPDGKTLTGIVTVEDPETFNAPLTMKQQWFKVNAPMSETICADDHEDYFHQNLFPLPQDDTPDF